MFIETNFEPLDFNVDDFDFSDIDFLGEGRLNFVPRRYLNYCCL